MKLRALSLVLALSSAPLLAAGPVALPGLPSQLIPDPLQAMQMALRYYQMAANAGDAEAQTKMGWLFEQGLGCRQGHRRSGQMV
jgi:TPR repeat protein